MSLADGIFASAIRGTIAEPAVRMVNFRARGLGIGTMHFIIVSGSITRGIIKCKIDSSKVTRGAAAVYSSDDKTIYGLRAEGFYADEKQTFVHECAHAVIHLMGFNRARETKVKILDNETAGYLAGAMYVVASGQMLSNLNNAPASAAYRIASKKGIAAGSTVATNAGSPIEFSDAELAPLLAAIKADPLYRRKWNDDEVQQWR
jgi:hypothetical protein